MDDNGIAMARFGLALAGSCMSKICLGMRCNTRRRMGTSRHASSPKGWLGGGATMTRWRSGEWEVGPVALRASLVCRDSSRPVYGRGTPVRLAATDELRWLEQGTDSAHI
jgi:hypothetical protein